MEDSILAQKNPGLFSVAYWPRCAPLLSVGNDGKGLTIHFTKTTTTPLPENFFNPLAQHSGIGPQQVRAPWPTGESPMRYASIASCLVLMGGPKFMVNKISTGLRLALQPWQWSPISKLQCLLWLSVIVFHSWARRLALLGLLASSSQGLLRSGLAGLGMQR